MLSATPIASVPASTVAIAHTAASTTAFPNESPAIGGRIHAAIAAAITRPAKAAIQPAATGFALIVGRRSFFILDTGSGERVPM
jgi:proline racemase